MITIEKEKDLLDELRKHRKFISIGEDIKTFNDVCRLDDNIIDFKYDIFSPKTQKNLKRLSEMLNWRWRYVIKYNVDLTHPRYGYFVYGIGKNRKLVNFHRKETRSIQAGQTIIHIGTKNLQIHRILKNEFRGESELKLLRKLTDVSSGLEFEKMLFERL